MTPQSDHKEPSKTPKLKGKGARRVSNLSEEQRNKKRENDRIAQQNIRRRNKELIENLQQEVNALKRKLGVDRLRQALIRNKLLEAEVCNLRKALEAHTGRQYHAPDTDSLGLPIEADVNNYEVAHAYGSPYGGGNPYDQWPSSVVPVPAAATMRSPESSPRLSEPREDFTPAYGHTGVPMAMGRVMATHTSAPSLDSSKARYEEADRGPSTNRHTNHGGQQSSTYLQEQPSWPAYPVTPYYTHAT
ncbi:uncharacterized protein B0H64DRAFT_375691 [Chaetomium fimeti]|uniref:BZIP domain-containing protein n=1 Tax=Chaetomium fimeti TaxID=1854472 RepID=A0AAE0HFZ0_9PEZI|nr:hypothetical protein B0H64DRAFT_375691 [Chaetomium fimeti]